MRAAPHALSEPGRSALDLLFHASVDCIKLLDLDGRVRLMNSGGAAAMELDGPGQLAGREWVAFWPQGPQREEARAALEQARMGRAGQCRGFLATAKGRPKWWDTVITPVREPDGSVGALLAVSRDVTAQHRLTAQLTAASQRMEALIAATGQTVWRTDATQSTGSGLSNAQSALAGLDSHTREGWLARVHPDDLAGVRARSAAGIATGRNYTNQYRMRGQDDVYRWIEVRAVPVRDEMGTLTEWIGVVTDVDERVRHAEALRDSEEQLRLALQASQIGIWDTDLTANTRRWSPEFKALLGLPPEAEASEKLMFALVHPDDLTELQDVHRTMLWPDDGLTFRVRRADTGEVRWLLLRGKTELDAGGRAVRRRGTALDITDRKLVEQRLWAAANKDPLTALPNRALFTTNLERAIAGAQDRGGHVVLMIVDLDRFKEVNDTLGHDAGDAVLRAAGQRLSALAPPDSTVARLGGDEFAVLLHDAPPPEAVQQLAAQMLRELSAPLDHPAGPIACSASIGIAAFPDQDQAGGELLKNADLALYAAKRGGRSRSAVFEPVLKQAMQARVTVLQDGRHALDTDAIVPFYQPKVGLDGSLGGGFEALLRWRTEGGIKGPMALAAAFEDPVLAAAIGARMLDRVLADLVAWRRAGLRPGSVAINVAAAEFAQVDVAARWLAALDKAGLPPDALQMEVTEQVFLDEGADGVSRAIGALHEAGVGIALDDFGTGFASLTHLRRQPVDWLKLDRSFIGDLDADADARAIVSATIDLAHGIGIRVVGEGVETEAQRALLALKRCDLAQGYLFARPMPAGSVPAYLSAHGSRAAAARTVAQG